MENRNLDLWTIEELSERVAEALADDYYGVPSGRVRDVPDLRTIRYYTTLGLLDRPAAKRGRTALYGLRHVLQLVAIKRLQAQGLSLAEVQARVLGLSNGALEQIAEVPEPWTERSGDHGVCRADSFWRAGALRSSPAQGGVPSAAAQSRQPRVKPAVMDQEQASREVSEAIALGEGLMLSVTTRRAITQEDLRVLRMAAAPLIEILRLRGLIGPGPSEPGDTP